MAAYSYSAINAEGFQLTGEVHAPDLDAAHWSPMRMPLPTGGEHIALDPHAEVAVAAGEVCVTIAGP